MPIPADVFTEIDYRIQKMNSSWSSSNKKYHYQFILELFEKYPELNKYYWFNDNAYYYDDRIREKEKIHIFSTENENNINEYDPERKWQMGNGVTSGLYFIGNIEYNPILEKPIYWVKIGKAENIEKRLQQYRTHNPSFWHNGCNLPLYKEELKPYEDIAHVRIAENALQKHPNADEWFAVTKEIYFELCRVLSTEKGFYEFLIRKNLKDYSNILK